MSNFSNILTGVSCCNFDYFSRGLKIFFQNSNFYPALYQCFKHIFSVISSKNFARIFFRLFLGHLTYSFFSVEKTI